MVRIRGLLEKTFPESELQSTSFEDGIFYLLQIVFRDSSQTLFESNRR
jgi:hypothetical protein